WLKSRAGRAGVGEEFPHFDGAVIAGRHGRIEGGVAAALGYRGCRGEQHQGGQPTRDTLHHSNLIFSAHGEVACTRTLPAAGHFSFRSSLEASGMRICSPASGRRKLPKVRPSPRKKGGMATLYGH